MAFSLIQNDPPQRQARANAIITCDSATADLPKSSTLDVRART
jgi:hypothetical protein